MKNVKWLFCGGNSIKYGTAKLGFKRWQCRECGNVFTNIIDYDAKQLNIFLKWLFGK